MAKIKGVIFDKDGVITDSIPFYFKILCEIYQEQIPYATYYDNCIQHMHSSNHIFKKAPPADFDKQIYRLYMKYFRDFTLIHNAPEVLESLKPNFKRGDYLIGLATNNYSLPTNYEFKRFKLTKYFDCITTIDDVDTHKPDPLFYKMSAKRLGLKPEECVAVEDSVAGLKSALGARIRTFALMNDDNKNYDFTGAIKINDLMEIPEIIEGLK